MAWEDVPAKLAQYAQEHYAPPMAVPKLFAEYEVPTNDPAAVPHERRADFEADLDYRLGACINLRKSRAWRHTTK